MLNIEFKILDLKDNINIMKEFYSKSDKEFDSKLLIEEYFPGINDDNFEEVITNTYNKNFNDLNDNINKYSNIWKEFNDEFFNNISEYLNIKVDINAKCYIGLLPIFPRFLETNSFYIAPNIDNDYFKIICAHELCHFIWFKKFKEVLPEISESEYNSPNKAWSYSEMVVDPVLNSIGIKEKAYDYFYDLKDNDNKNLMEELNNIYKENLSIEEKIKKGYKYILENLED